MIQYSVHENPNKKELYFTIVYYSLLYFKTMVLWNFDLLWENYGTFEKTMVLWKKNYGTLYRELWNFDLRRKETL